MFYCICVCLFTTCIREPAEVRQGFGSCGTGVTDCWPWVFWEPNLLEEQSVLLSHLSTLLFLVLIEAFVMGTFVNSSEVQFSSLFYAWWFVFDSSMPSLCGRFSPTPQPPHSFIVLHSWSTFNNLIKSVRLRLSLRDVVFPYLPI